MKTAGVLAALAAGLSMSITQASAQTTPGEPPPSAARDATGAGPEASQVPARGPAPATGNGQASPSGDQTAPPASPADTASRAQPSARPPQWYTAQTGEIRGSRLLGVTVRNAAGESIGDVNELVIGRDGRVAALVVGVGGFLGLGERNVAVGFGTIRMTTDSSGTPVVVLAADRTTLSNAPEWKWSDADRSGLTGAGTGASVTTPAAGGRTQQQQTRPVPGVGRN